MPYPIVDVIIPAYNEETSVPMVLMDIPKNTVREIIVVSNASTDNTVLAASSNGATVLKENEKGYGAACLKGIAYLKQKAIPPDVVVFLDADYSDHPEEMPLLLHPIIENDMDLVIGARHKVGRESGSMTPQQVFGNALATQMMKTFFNINFSDLGPFRAIKWRTLDSIGMTDRNWGWTVEMQIKVGKNGFKYCEVPVTYRRRIGVSKVSGTIKGTIMAGYKIIYTILKYR